MTATLERERTTDDEDTAEFVKARVLLGGRWFDIEYRPPDDDQEPLDRIVMRSASMGHQTPLGVLPARWSWNSGAREGHLILSQIEGIADDGTDGD